MWCGVWVGWEGVPGQGFVMVTIDNILAVGYLLHITSPL